MPLTDRLPGPLVFAVAFLVAIAAVPQHPIGIPAISAASWTVPIGASLGVRRGRVSGSGGDGHRNIMAVAESASTVARWAARELDPIFVNDDLSLLGGDLCNERTGQARCNFGLHGPEGSAALFDPRTLSTTGPRPATSALLNRGVLVWLQEENARHLWTPASRCCSRVATERKVSEVLTIGGCSKYSEREATADRCWASRLTRTMPRFPFL